jgi:DNA (cytosine-5)-methyltransferase 1
MEKTVDNFAGGGGASDGIKRALDRMFALGLIARRMFVDIAINHDRIAIAMHEVNHPETLHLCNNVWKVDPDDVEGDIGLGWFSPDCKHFSKAKGGKPVEKGIRDLAWVVIRWARRKAGGPRIIILENVEEFSTWGPLGADDRPCPDRKGETFKRWVGELRRLGYKVEWRELRACDFGAPTIRRRLFLIARRDGEPIVWPPATHGDPKSDDVKAGRLKPWRTAAEIIDWSLPCPSIFASSEDIMAEYGIRAVRPLAEATMSRIARGVKRYVIDAASPFIVNLTHQGGDRTEPLGEPLNTVTGAHRGEKALAVPTLIQTGYGERAGQEPRVPGLEKPLGTAVAGGIKHALVAPFVTGVGGRMAQTEPRSADQPVQTITAKADSVLVAPHLMTMRNAQKPFNGGDEPTHTITSGGARLHLVAAFMAQHNIDGRNGRGNPGRSADVPVSTILQSGSHQGPVAVNLVRQFGTGVGSSVDEPARTVMADGGGKTQLSAAFLTKYYGVQQDSGMDEPVHTATAKPRFGLVTVMIGGEPYVVSDIGLRMLTPRELFRAQGFDDSYIIDRTPDGSPISKSDQVAKCGNSVCPDLADALVFANYRPRAVSVDRATDAGFALEAAAS